MNLLKEENKKLVKGKSGKVYLIDSENINDVWVNLLDRMEEHDRIIVFYTDKSAHMSYDKIIRLLERDKGSLTWVKCYPGQNALDFQLVSVLGAMIVKSSKREYVIVADDCGYDAAVKYWRRCKGKVSRMKSSECAKIVHRENPAAEVPFGFLKSEREDAEPTDEGPGKKEEKTGKDKKRKNSQRPEREEEKRKREEEEPSAETEDGTEYGDLPEVEPSASPEGEAERTDLPVELSEEAIEFLKRLSISVSIKNKSLYHNALICLLGQDMGNRIYHTLASDKELRRSIHAQTLPTKRERVSAYLELILEKEGTGTADLDRLVGWYLQNPRANLQLLNMSLVKKFGAEKGGIYYRVIKKHIKVLQNI